MNINLLLPFIVSFLLTILFVPPTIKFAKKFKLLDDPKKHKHPAIIHKKPIPERGATDFSSSCISAIFILP